jgi:hypothetical protein
MQWSPASASDDHGRVTERWETPEQIAAARSRYAAAIPGWQYPRLFGLGRLVDGRVGFARINTAEHRLPAVVLATVCGHTAGSASYLLDVSDLDRALDMLAPAEADVSQPHPNLWAWRRFRTDLGAGDVLVAIFDADPAEPSDDPYVLAMRAAAPSTVD